MKPWFLLSFALCAYADAPKIVGLLCYPSDALIAASCEAFEKQMKECGYSVVRVNDFSGDLAKTKPEDAKKLKTIPPNAPVFITSHGNSFGKKHYLDSLVGDVKKNQLGRADEWNIDPTVELMQVDIPDNERVFATDPILNAMEEHPLVLSACFSGRACEVAKPKLNLIASCGSIETSKNLTVQKGLYQEPVLYWAGQLYCDPTLFAAADTDEPKGTLTEKELLKFLAAKMGGKKTVHTVIYTTKPNIADTTNLHVLDEAVAEKEAKRILDQALATHPGFKGSVKYVGDLYEVTFKNGSPSYLLPQWHNSKYGAESAAKKWGEKQTPPATGFEVVSKGKVREVVLEDTSQACAITGFGTTQTPFVRGTIQGRPTHK